MRSIDKFRIVTVYRAAKGSLMLVATGLSSDAGVVEDWNSEMIQVFQEEATAPCLGSRHLGLLHVAMYDAVNLCAPRHFLYRPVPESERPAAEIREQLADPNLAALAGAAAAHEILQALAPTRKAEFDQLLIRHIGAPVADEVQRAAIATGRRVAARLFSEREDDGSSTTVHYEPNSKLGHWRRTEPNFRPPEGPHWGLVKPFCLDNPWQFRAPPPPELESEELSKALDEVRSIGGKNSTIRTEEQTLIARFWSDFSYTSTPPGHWNEILRDISKQENLDLHQSARAFFLLNLAMVDAGIAIWDSKYHYDTWRPVTAIQHYGAKDWGPLLVTPPHPDYLSGHSGFSGAAAKVLERLFPNRPADWSFTVRSDTVKNATRIFTSFADCAKECSISRVYGGIHFRHACEEGLVLGEKVGDEVMKKHGGS